MIVITSKTNELIRKAYELKDKKYVKQYGECLVESEKIVDQLRKAGRLSTILVDSECTAKYQYILDSFDGKIVYISPKISQYLADSSTSSGIFGFAKVPLVNTDIISGNALILDSLQDPGNLGSIVRSARAFGFNDIILINSVYPYSYKAIRASMGYIFDVNIHEANYTELKRLVDENDITILLADMGGVNIRNYNLPSKIALVIGNEGNGISQEIKSMKFDAVSIPMQNNVESLNAGVSAAIIMNYIVNKE